jgi:peptidoglycan hydrolase-like protein with peptidoglycan-binding domain
VRELQRKLKASGFDPGAADGVYGQRTVAAVRAFQAARGLAVDGVAGPRTLGALSAAGPAPVRPEDSFSGSTRTYKARGTAYFPDNDPIEGGFVDRKGNKLNTLEDHLAGKAPFVSVAMDATTFPYGTKLRIPELEQRYGRRIDFRVVDTGSAFRGKGTSRIDVCVKNRAASFNPTINGPLSLVVER